MKTLADTLKIGWLRWSRCGWILLLKGLFSRDNRNGIWTIKISYLRWSGFEDFIVKETYLKETLTGYEQVIISYLRWFRGRDF